MRKHGEMRIVEQVLSVPDAYKFIKNLSRMLSEADSEDYIVLTHLLTKHAAFTSTPEIADNLIVATAVAQCIDKSEISLPFTPKELDEIIDSFEKIG